MTVLQLIAMVLEVLIEAWKFRNDPEQARIRAALQATKSLNKDMEKIDEAIAANDGVALSAHFEQLSARVRKLPKPPSDYSPRR